VSQTEHSLTVSNHELATVRDAMRQLHHLLDALDDGDVEKIVLTQKNQMRAVLVSVERYSRLQQRGADQVPGLADGGQEVP
jgi:prevent-host-death family protein